MNVNLINKAFLRGRPEIGVVAEGTVVAIAYFDDFFVAERAAALEAKEGGEHAEGVVERSKRIHLGVEAQATTDGAYLIGKTGTKEEETIAVKDGLG